RPGRPLTPGVPPPDTGPDRAVPGRAGGRARAPRALPGVWSDAGWGGSGDPAATNRHRAGRVPHPSIPDRRCRASPAPERNAGRLLVHLVVEADAVGVRRALGHRSPLLSIGAATRGRTRRVSTSIGGSADAEDVAPGKCPRPVPALTCVASNGRVRSSG